MTDIHGSEFVVAEQQEPNADVTPADADCTDLIGSMADTIKVTGNIFSTQIVWKSKPPAQ